jgi:hypothetical protein
VLEEYVSFEFNAGHDRRKEAPFAYTMTNSQVDGILYMVGHVRDLAVALDIAFDKAFGLSPVDKSKSGENGS